MELTDEQYQNIEGLPPKRRNTACSESVICEPQIRRRFCRAQTAPDPLQHCKTEMKRMQARFMRSRLFYSNYFLSLFVFCFDGESNSWIL
jgi:hypothetical protein